MNQYTIVKNEYLSKDIKAFYRCVYQGYGKVGNPDYINYLKNTFNNAPRYKIEAAKNSVKSNLADELFNVLSTISDTEVAICVIPRSEPPRDCRRLNILREYDNENTKLHS